MKLSVLALVTGAILATPTLAAQVDLVEYLVPKMNMTIYYQAPYFSFDTGQLEPTKFQVNYDAASTTYTLLMKNGNALVPLNALKIVATDNQIKLEPQETASAAPLYGYMDYSANAEIHYIVLPRKVDLDGGYKGAETYYVDRLYINQSIKDDCIQFNFKDDYSPGGMKFCKDTGYAGGWQFLKQNALMSWDDQKSAN